MRARFVALAALAASVVASPSFAGHHLWDTTEIFSNASRSVQYIEIFTAEDNEQNLNGFTITASGHTFTFNSNLPTAVTANTWVLVATSNFASLPGGIDPDYILPAAFFSTSGGTVNYAGVDSWNYGTVPTDGVNALQRNGSTAVNSPKNFDGDTGSVNAASAVPASGTWGIVLLVGALLFAASGLLRRRGPAVA